jgi:hypothetical protein
MMRSLRSIGCAAALAVSACVSFVSTSVHAVYNAIDAVPGATVLIPYFEVDLANTSGRSTLVSITNSSATAILARATVWTNANLPVFSFDVYFTGYDVVSLNMRDVLNGTLPVTASAGQDPSGTISRKGIFSQDINYASCTGTLPLPAISANTVADLRAALTGTAVPNGTLRGVSAGQCVGMTKGDNVARGYITFDTVNGCGTSNHLDGTSYLGDTATSTRQNTLWGDYMIIDPSQNTAYGDLATMLEGRPYTDVPVPGTYSFYARFVNGSDADAREGLATHWATHLDRDSTELQVWRDTRMVLNPSAVGFTCGTSPSPQPMAVNGVGALNMDSTVETVGTNTLFGTPIGSYPMTNAATGMTGSKKLGQLHVQLSTSIAGTNDVEFAADTTATQGLVTAVRRPRGGAMGFRSSAVAFPMNQVGDLTTVSVFPPFPSAAP